MLSRRHFLRRITYSGGAMIGLGSSSCTDARVLGPRIEPAPTPPDYGPLAPAGPELALPAGFEYAVIGVEGTPMADGRPTPRAHDGMGAFPLPNGNIRLVRNHEDRDRATVATPKGDPTLAYDPSGGGSATSLEIGRMCAYPGTITGVEVVRDFVSLSGTIVNCNGAPTPWG